MKKIISIVLIAAVILILALGAYIYFKPLPPFMIQNCTHPGDMGLLYVLEGKNEISCFYHGAPKMKEETKGADYEICWISEEYPDLYPNKTTKINLLQKLNILRLCSKITVDELRYTPVNANEIDKYFEPPYLEKINSSIFRYHMEYEHISYDFVVPDPDKNEYVIDSGENLAKLAIAMISYNPPPEPLKKSIHKWVEKFDGNVVRKTE